MGLHLLRSACCCALSLSITLAATGPAHAAAGAAPKGGGGGNAAAPKPNVAALAPKVNICHATGSKKNPYVTITVSENGLNGHGRHANDIIPAPAAGCPRAGDPAPIAPAPVAPTPVAPTPVAPTPPPPGCATWNLRGYPLWEGIAVNGVWTWTPAQGVEFTCATDSAERISIWGDPVVNAVHTRTASGFAVMRTYWFGYGTGAITLANGTRFDWTTETYAPYALTSMVVTKGAARWSVVKPSSGAIPSTSVATGLTAAEVVEFEGKLQRCTGMWSAPLACVA